MENSVCNTFMEVFNCGGNREYVDVEVCPYLVRDLCGRSYWYSPVTMEPVVVQLGEGHA